MGFRGFQTKTNSLLIWVLFKYLVWPAHGGRNTNICGDRLYLLAPNGTIKSPSYPKAHTELVNCTWTILAPPLTNITVTLEDLDIESDENCDSPPCCTSSWLIVTSLESIPYKSIPYRSEIFDKILCGRNFSKNSIPTGRGLVRIVYYSAAMSTGRGFSLSYKMDNTRCRRDEFRCKDGHCLPGAMRCDKVAQCVDQSDELDCKDTCIEAGKVSCGPQSIPSCFDNATQRCNGIKDCESGRDELGCEAGACDRRCSTGQCYSIHQHCNNITDCSDFSDEMDCGYCPYGQVLCGPRSGSHCFDPQNQRCDGDFDCPHGEDEGHCARLCVSGLPCRSGDGCYSPRSRCDSFRDCSDGSDELDCFNKPVSPERCRKDEVKCPFSSKCIPMYAYCDGTNDCGDFSDEANCVKKSLSAPVMGGSGAAAIFVAVVLYRLLLFTKRAMETRSSMGSIQMPQYVGTRLSAHSVSLPVLLDDDYFLYREPPPAYSLSAGQNALENAQSEPEPPAVRPYVPPSSPPPPYSSCDIPLNIKLDSSEDSSPENTPIRERSPPAYPDNSGVLNC